MKGRKTRSDCTVGSFEKSTVYHQEQFVIKMAEIPGAIRRLEQSVRSIKNDDILASNKSERHPEEHLWVLLFYFKHAKTF